MKSLAVTFGLAVALIVSGAVFASSLDFESVPQGVVGTCDGPEGQATTTCTWQAGGFAFSFLSNFTIDDGTGFPAGQQSKGLYPNRIPELIPPIQVHPLKISFSPAVEVSLDVFLLNEACPHRVEAHDAGGNIVAAATVLADRRVDFKHLSSPVVEIWIGRTQDQVASGFVVDNLRTCEGTDPLDYDCDGVPDLADNCPAISNPGQADIDGDGFGGDCDCNDASATTHPDATEICDGYDNDCNGDTDDTATCPRQCDAPGTAPDEVILGGSYPDPIPVVWTGNEYAVAWDDFADIWLARFSASGDQFGTAIQVTSTAPGVSAQPSLVWTGTELGVAWSDQRDTPGESNEIYFVRLDNAGIKIGPEIRITNASGHSQYPSLVWNGSGYAMVWLDGRDGDLCHLYFARLDATGARQTPDIRITSLATCDSMPSLQWSGSGYGLAWMRKVGTTFRVFFTTLDENGVHLTPDLQVPATNAESELPSLRWTGDGYGISWNDFRGGIPADVYFARLSPAGAKVGSDQLIGSDAATTQLSLAWTGEEYGLVFQSVAASSGEIYFARLALDGAVIGDATQTTNTAVNSLNPTLGWNGSDYAVAWNEAGTAYYRRLTCPCIDLDNDDVCSAIDCNDQNSAVFPGANEVCNTIDDNCNGLLDEDAVGVDSDGDGVRNACDNCRFAFNSAQLDTDSDGHGNACDNCALLANPSQADTDSDQRGNACDNCPTAYNPSQDDFDGDRSGDACDNCVFEPNSSQTDFNQDGEGDLCDLNDGLIYVFSTDKDYREWQAEVGYTAWNSYRGSLSVLRATGQYTQAPGSNSLAVRDCGLSDPFVLDDVVPVPGAVAFNLVTGVAGGVESSLGTNSAGTPRPNSTPCP